MIKRSFKNTILKIKRQGGWLSHRGGGYRRVISITVSSDVLDAYNLYTGAGSPADVVDVILTINSGIALQSGIITGSFVSGSTIKIINNGTIAGTGGSGARGATVTSSGFSRDVFLHNGGDAISLSVSVTIDNTNGFIYGGGGGGGGGGASASTNPPLDNKQAAGGGGGGGRGRGGTKGQGGTTVTSPSGDGHDGTNGDFSAKGTGGTSGAIPGSGGDGGDGGDWGENGGSGTAISGSGYHSTLNNTPGSFGGPGLAGYAIRTNGFSVTWLGGNNATQVKGLVG